MKHAICCTSIEVGPRKVISRNTVYRVIRTRRGTIKDYFVVEGDDGRRHTLPTSFFFLPVMEDAQ